MAFLLLFLLGCFLPIFKFFPPVLTTLNIAFYMFFISLLLLVNVAEFS